LLVHVRVRPDPVFRREGNDIHSEIPVPMAAAALGGSVPMQTLRGRVNLTVPPGTSSGAELRLRGQGIRGGDHLARVMVTVPGNLTPRQRELLEEFGKGGS
jgi:molecular chaperone DnaJ